MREGIDSGSGLDATQVFDHLRARSRSAARAVNAPRRLLLWPRAAADLEEICRIIAARQPETGRATFVAELEAKCRAVAATPEFYPARRLHLLPDSAAVPDDMCAASTAICASEARPRIERVLHGVPRPAPARFRPGSRCGHNARPSRLPSSTRHVAERSGARAVERGNDDRVQRDDQPVGFRAHRSPPQKPAPSPNLTAPPEPPAHSS